MSKEIPSIGDNIREIRLKKGITQKELASRIGKSYSSIQKYEMGLAVPPISVVERLAEALDVDKFEIYGWNEFELKEKSPEPEGSEDRFTVEEVKALLTALGFGDKVDNLSEKDIAFFGGIFQLLDAWFK